MPADKRSDFMVKRHDIELTETQFQHYLVEMALEVISPSHYPAIRQRVKQFAGIEVSDDDIEKAVEDFSDAWNDAWPS